MKRILIYGDSNVWGDTPDPRRLPDDQQWANILAKKLGKNYKIVQEGLCTRYAGGFKYSAKPYRNGQLHFEPIFRTATPVDLIILALGTNDLNTMIYSRSPEQIAQDILWYEPKVAKITARYPKETMPKFIYVLPPNIDHNIISEIREMIEFDFDEKTRQKLNEILRQKVKNFVEINDIKLFGDGLHFLPEGHQQMANAVFAKIKEMEVENGQ